MPGIGTIVNTLAVILGSAIGMVAKKGLSQSLQDSIMKVLGIAVIFIGISSTMQEMLTVGEDGSLAAGGTMLMIVSLVIGTLIGELLKIETGLESIGDRMKKLKFFQGSSQFTEGFVTSTLVICIGAMAIVGALKDGLEGDPTMLYSKSILDFLSTMIFASALGVGVLCSAIPLALYQGSITLLAGIVGTFLTDQMISDMSMVGSILIFCVGINLFAGKKIKVGNMLPSLIVPIVYDAVSGLL